MCGHTRRTLLRTSLGLGLTGSLVGCSRLDRSSTPEPTGTFLDCLPAPSVTGAEHHEVAVLSAADARRYRDAIHPATGWLFRGRGPTRPFRPLLDLLDGVDRYVDAGPARLHLGAGTGTLDGVLREKGYRHLRTDGDFEFYRSTPQGLRLYRYPEVVAVGENVVVESVRLGQGTFGVEEGVQAVVDAKRGDVTRFHEGSEDAARVASLLSDAIAGYAAAPDWRGPFGGITVYGYRRSVDRAATAFRELLSFEDEPDARVADVGAHVREVAPEHRGYAVERDGTVVTATAEIDTARFDLGYPGNPGADGIPDGRFAVSAADGDDQSVVRHDGGQAVDAGVLGITVDGELTARQFADEHDVVENGDAVAVDVGRGTVLRVVWWARGAPVDEDEERERSGGESRNHLLLAEALVRG
jgi:hypothetical protein